jgi:sporulation protein YlmC with PRC-barrel domain
MHPKTVEIIFCCVFLALLPAGPLAGAESAGDGEVTAGSILDREVYASGGALIGEVDDLVIRRSGRIKTITIEYGGVLGIGDRLVALPFKSADLQEEKVAIDLTEEQLDKEPAFDYYQRGLRPDYYYRNWRTPYRHYYATPPADYGPPRRPPARGDYDVSPPPHPYLPSGGYPYDPSLQGSPDLSAWSYSPARFLASAIINRRLINESGQHIGRVYDLVIDPKAQKVVRIVIGVEQILGEEVQVVLDYEPLGFTPHGLVYDIEAHELKDYIAPRKQPEKQ